MFGRRPSRLGKGRAASGAPCLLVCCDACSFGCCFHKKKAEGSRLRRGRQRRPASTSPSATMALALRAELLRFHREHAAPAVNWAALRGLDDDDAPADPRISSCGTGIYQGTIQELATVYPLKSDGMAGLSLAEQGARWAVAVREQAVQSVRLRMEAAERAQAAAAAAAAEEAARAYQAASTAATDTSRQQLEWALQAQKAMNYEKERESRQLKKQWTSASDRVGVGRAAMLGGLFASTDRADERST